MLTLINDDQHVFLGLQMLMKSKWFITLHALEIKVMQ